MQIVSGIVGFTYNKIARAKEQALQAKQYVNPCGELLNYRIYLLRDLNTKKRYPLVLFLHGSDRRGADNKRQLKDGVYDIIAYSEKTNKPFILLAPQCPKKILWVDTPWEADDHTMPEVPSQPMKLTIELLQTAIIEMPVDTNRVYVTGLSVGGFGVWDLLQRKPELFAAAVPVCGGGDRTLADKIKHIPIWAFHGEKDKIVKTTRSRMMIEALREIGGTPRYTEYKGVGHNAWTQTYKNEEMLEWFFNQSKLSSEEPTPGDSKKRAEGVSGTPEQ